MVLSLERIHLPRYSFLFFTLLFHLISPLLVRLKLGVSYGSVREALEDGWGQ